MGISLKISITSKYLLVISALLIISSLLFAPWSPISIWGDEYITPDFVTTTFNIEQDEVLEYIYDERVGTKVTLSGENPGIISFLFDNGADLSSIRILADGGVETLSITFLAPGYQEEEICSLVWTEKTDLEYEFEQTYFDIEEVILELNVTGLSQIFEVSFKGEKEPEPEKVNCYSCVNEELQMDEYENTCPDGWYEEGNVPNGFCGGNVPNEIIPYWWIIIGITLSVVAFYIVKKRGII